VYSSTPVGAGNAAMDLWMLDLENNEPQPLLADPGFGELSADVSPDGRWLAYLISQNGYRIYVRPFPGGGATTLVGNGREPRWSPTGNRLYYRSGNAMMAVDFDDAGTPGPARVVIENAARPDGQLAGSYDIAPDERFLFREVEVLGASGEAGRITVFFNWLENLERLMAAGR